MGMDKCYWCETDGGFITYPLTGFTASYSCAAGTAITSGGSSLAAASPPIGN